MRFTLEQLETLVPKILTKGYVNKPIEGYPILHQLMVELRDERDKSKHERYYDLISKVLCQPGVDVDVLDKHRKPSLAYAGEQGNLRLVKLLLKCGANPNLVDKAAQMSALEWTVYSNPIAKDIISLLSRITKRTAQMLENCKELFDRAIEEEEVDWINALVDCQLVEHKISKPATRTHALTDTFKQGLWIRTVYDHKAEADILHRREALTDAQLMAQRHTENSKDSSYTRYSPATYVMRGAPISLFGFNVAGVIIKPKGCKIPYWYDGHQEELTRDMFYADGTKLDNKNTGQLWEATEKDIARMIVGRYKKEIMVCRSAENLDRHGVLLNRMIQDIRFSWNEGLIRYKRKEITGIYVDPDSKESSIKALALRKDLGIPNAPLYHYDGKGNLHRVYSEELIKKWNILESAAKTAPQQHSRQYRSLVTNSYQQQTMSNYL